MTNCIPTKRHGASVVVSKVTNTMSAQSASLETLPPSFIAKPVAVITILQTIVLWKVRMNWMTLMYRKRQKEVGRRVCSRRGAAQFFVGLKAWEGDKREVQSYHRKRGTKRAHILTVWGYYRPHSTWLGERNCSCYPRSCQSVCFNITVELLTAILISTKS
jgi:hypothetical protein